MSNPLYRVGGLCEKDHRRRVERWAIVREVTPAQMRSAGAAQLALIISSVTEKGKTTTATQHFYTSRDARSLDPVALLQLRHNQWGIESICHQRLDVSQAEDKTRARSVSAVAVLGLLCRISLAIFSEEIRKPGPVRDKTYPVWSGRLRRNPRPIIDRMLERCLPP